MTALSEIDVDRESVVLGRCPACASPDSRLEAVTDDLTLRRCSACTLVYSDPQPRGEVYRHWTDDLDLASHFAERSRRKEILFRRRLRRLPRPVAGRNRLCDVGCGDGQFLNLARAAGWEVLGVEPNASAAERAAQHGLTIVRSRLEAAEDLAWGTFDVVTAWDVLEHTAEPRAFAESLARLVAPTFGVVALTTLNRASLAYAMFGTEWSMVTREHFTYWNRKALTTLFRRSGLEPVEYETFGVGRDFVHWIDRARERRSRPAMDTAVAWDVNRAVLAVEGVVNRLLGLTGGGVGISLTLRRA